MTYRGYVSYMTLGTLMAVAVFLATIFSVSPYQGPAGILLFYLSLFLSLIGIFSLCGLGTRVLILRTKLMRLFVVRDSFRQAIFLSLFLIACLMLQKMVLLHWWSFVLLFVFVVSLEFFFSSSNHV